MHRKLKNLNVWIAILILIVAPFSVIVVEANGIGDSKHNFSYSPTLAPKGVCSACHSNRMGEELLWARELTEEEAYFNQTSNPNYVLSNTILCYDCHDNHNAVDNDPDYNLFINSSLGRYIPQDVAFDSDMQGNDESYDSSPSDQEVGFYETDPPNTVPPIDGSDTGGHFIKSIPSNL